MTRLNTELQRLYLPPRNEADETSCQHSGLIALNGQVRALVLEVFRPAQWPALAKVWKGVQTDLALPAPAIAVSGTDGYQLWFSLTEPVQVSQAQAFLRHLRQRYLGDLAPERVRLLPAPDDAATGGAVHASLVPALHEETGHWSAFVSADLASIFEDDPWLDRSPGADAQADLLCRLKSISSAAFQLALHPVNPPAPAADVAVEGDSALVNSDQESQRNALDLKLDPKLDPKRFLRQVMNDPAAALHLRIEAAKALLPYST